MTAPRPDLDALLRCPTEPLPPPPGAWLDIRRRARRMRTARRATAVAAVLAVVTAVAVPAALLLHEPPARTGTSAAAGRAHSAQQHTPAAWPTPDTTTYSRWRPPPALRDLHPLSVSFIEQNIGYLLGRTGGRLALAVTRNGGDSWAPLALPAGFATPGPSETAGVRFATEHVGFLFGSSYWRTTDGGRSWQRLPAPGRITDIEMAGGLGGRMWALAQQCPRACGVERLYSGRVDGARLQPVLDVTPLPDAHAQLSLTASGAGVFVLANRPQGGPFRFWSTNGGRTWNADNTAPCVHEGTIAALIASEAAVVCSAPGRHGDQARAFVVLDHLSRTKHHQRSDYAAPPVGDLSGMTANNSGGVVLVDGFAPGQPAGAPFQVSADGGRSWQPSGPHLPGGAQFAGFISSRRVVALSAARGEAFLASNDGGQSWRVTSFAG